MISKKDHKFLNLALNESLKSPLKNKHGCVATINGKVIAKGYNHERTQISFLNQKIFSCHAEIDTIRKIDSKKIKKIKLYIVRTNRNGEFKNSSPCIDCFNYIKKVKQLIYTKNKNSILKCKPEQYHHIHYCQGRKVLNYYQF